MVRKNETGTKSSEKDSVHSDKKPKHQPIKVPKVSQSVANQIRKMIILGELKHGERLQFEADLIEQFGVSRPTIREAIRILESEGLLVVTRGSRQGPLVQKPTIEHASRIFGLLLQSLQTSIRDVYQARLYIEPIMARVVAENSSKSALSKLRDVIELELKYIDDDELFANYTNKFHETLVEIAGNKTISQFISMLHEVYVRQQYLITRNAPHSTQKMADKKRGVQAQNKLISLIEKGDGDAAEVFWRKNLAVMEKVLLKDHENDEIVDLLS